MALQFLLYLIGVILLLLAAFGITLSKVSFGWLGLAVIGFAALVLPSLT